ncbi:hypothetical protein G6F57_005157 [Rhizopus arrhizus]|nr:hypothetical protein G6F23_000983 [Rhizopus arrhizus]KAG1428423.1 hypothetical protein G6F58_000563 [Rhizopus delemar]KAG0764968.1 hypothetical protein G6F24_004799 [Rhizopus arrhizus]KAG0784749.1 hypothetical protein G6F22_008195 [Rhizopus arrhizus]KAG0792325.1 hypothetical protein G6F21_004440 [Rhizopus arrhizus]
MSWDSLLTPQETRLFSHLFQFVSKTQDGIVTGPEAVQFFATSGVPNEILSEIWEAADRDKVGYLTPETFAIALKLIACAQHGKEAIDPVLATTVPLPQFDGVVAPSPMITNNSLYDVPITPADREKYGSIFRVHQPINGIMDAETARSVFLKSKLPMDTLGQIWNLADTRRSGTLNQTEFTIAMHYIAKLMDGTLKNLPDKLPPAVFQSAAAAEAPSPLMRNSIVTTPSLANQTSIMTPPQRARTIGSLGNLAFGSSGTQDWDVTAQEKQQFNAYFEKIDSGRLGHIQGKEAVEFFKNSRLPESELAHIWDLSDIQQRGSLSRDEFAVAMHLIHKRLRGESLPQTLPKTLVPPSQRQPINVFASPTFASPIIASPAPAFSAPPVDNQNDLLGDFGNDQVSTETNQVNLLQNQISSLTSQTASIKDQKVSAENTLNQLAQQKKQLEAQIANVKIAYETAVKDLNELQEQVRREEAEWNSIRAEYNAAQQGLTAVQSEVTQVSQVLENGRAETESLKRRIVEIQEETRKTNIELDRLSAQSKQQNMMLDINRRQVTAAEQDRSLAERNLEDYKIAAGLSTTDQDDKEEKNEEKKVEPFLASQSTPSVMNTPALDTLFASPSIPVSDKPGISPFDQFAQEVTDNSTLEFPESTDITDGQNDFDTIFGAMSINPSAAVDSTMNAFDPIQWPTSPTSATAKTSRGAPPPPPQSRHQHQVSISSMESSTAETKKQRAPPPPPPVAASSVKDQKEDEDDFEAAFSDKQLPEATIVAKDDDFADFDDAFSSFDVNKQDKNVNAANDTNDEWASAFEPFNASNQNQQEQVETSKPKDDWDSIFGVTKTPIDKLAATPQPSGFDDSFSSFADDFGKQKVPATSSSPSTKAAVSGPIGIVGDKIQDLVKMGFGEKEAKDALNRYDQDLEKASNFLLDQAK